ncbi:MAG: hypothetical protein ACI9SQ_001980, partial [Rubritalea sp.]
FSLLLLCCELSIIFSTSASQITEKRASIVYSSSIMAKDPHSEEPPSIPFIGRFES